jgi:hypothetical protein
MSFLKNREQEGKTVPVEGWYQWEGEDIMNGCRRVNVVEIVCTYV